MRIHELGLVIMALAACKQANPESSASTVSVSAASSDAAVMVAVAPDAAPVKPPDEMDERMRHCPLALEGATSTLEDIPDGVRFTVKAPAAMVEDARRRARHIVDFAARRTREGHGGSEGMGGGRMKNCPVITDEVTITVRDVSDGVQLDVLGPQNVDWLRTETRDRAKKFPFVGATITIADAKSAAKRPRKDSDRLRMEEADMARFADMLTAEGPGVSEGDMSRRRPGADLGSQIADVRGNTVTTGGAGGGMRGGRIDTGSVTTGKVEGPSTPSGRISIASKSAATVTTLTADVALRKIQQAYMAGLKRCYRQALVQTPTARGAVTLSLDVSTTGRVDKATVTAFEAALATCMESLAASWRFPIPKDADGEPTSASFKFGLQFTPD